MKDIDLANPTDIENLQTVVETLQPKPAVAVKEQEPVKRENIITEKFSGRLYPCKLCGAEKVKETRGGYIPDYCDACGPKVRRLNLQKARLSKKKEEIFNQTIAVPMPDGSLANVRDADEKRFIELRLGQYKKDYDWTESSDCGLLTKLILLELQTNRISRLLTLRHKVSDAKVLADLTEEYRKCQSDLGINRTKRMEEKEVDDAPTIVQGLITKFKEYREKHPERFVWKCLKCGEINKLNIENPNADKFIVG